MNLLPSTSAAFEGPEAEAIAPRATRPLAPFGKRTMLDEWLTPGRFAGVLALLIFALYPDVVLGRATFFFRDFCMFGYPLAHHHRESFWRGEVPLWNPYHQCGLPFLAQWNTITLYPPALFYLVFPLSWSLGIFCLGHLVLAGLGMFCLVRDWSGSRLGAAVAGVGFAFNGMTWDALMWPNYIAALGWMPWVVWMARRAWREGGRVLILAALAGAMQMLAGTPEVTLLTWLVVSAVGLAEIVAKEDGTLGFDARKAMRFVGLVAWIAALAAAQLLPFLHLLAHSHRQGNYADAGWAMPPTGWANFLVPAFQTYKSSHGVRMQYDQLFTSSYYPGVGIVALAFVALWRVRERRVWILSSLAALALLLALGIAGPVYDALHRLFPPLRLMRYPVKYVLLVTFLAPLLAGLGVSWWRGGRESVPEPRRVGATFSLIGILFVVAMAAIVAFGKHYPMPNDEWPVLWRNAASRAALLGGVLFLSWRLATVASGTWQRALILALLGALWLDVRTHAPNLNPTVERSVFAPGMARTHLAFDPPARLGGARAMLSTAAFRELWYRSVATPLDDVIGRRLALLENLALLDEVPHPYGFYSLYLRDMAPITREAMIRTNFAAQGLVDFMAVAHTTVPGKLMDWQPRPTAMPFVTLGQKPAFATPTNTLRAALDPATDFRQVVFLPPEAATTIRATNAANGQVLAQRISAHRWEIEVEASAPTMVVFSQAYYPHWQATVDAAPARIWKANHAFQAVEVPAGRHRVELQYRDRMFSAGAAISGLALLGCVGGWFGFSRRRMEFPRGPVRGEVSTDETRLP